MNPILEVPVLEARGVSRTFGARRALDDVAIRVEPSSIHAVLGKNGAGKSTLMKVIAGSDLPDRGEILIKGEPVASGGIRAHEAAGVVYVPQELTVFPGLSVADQILLGDRYPVSPIRTIRRRTGEMRAKATICQLDDGIDPAAPVTSLSLPQLRTVMIARALHLDAKVLVLDEPTEAFSADEVDVLFTLLRTLVSGGVSILYVSHRLSEVFSLADTVTVLRDGRLVIAGQPVTEASADEVVAAIVNEPRDAGSPTATPTRIAAHGTPSDGDCLVFTPSPAPSSLIVRRGSVVGLAGLAGSGRTSIMNRLAGTVPLGEGDTLSIDGSGIDSGRKRLHAGVVLLPEDRAGLGLLPSLTVRENISIACLKALRNGRFPFLFRRRENWRVIQAMRAVGLDPALLDSPVMSLSGGNQQKVLIARGIFADAKIWLLDEPTVGLDVQSRKQVLSLVRELARGEHIDGRPNPSTGAIVASSDLDDLIEACDVVYVVDEGTVGAALTAPFTEEELLHATAFSHAP
jgi:galactofuranose transport system ATP-binding protein